MVGEIKSHVLLARVVLHAGKAQWLTPSARLGFKEGPTDLRRTSNLWNERWTVSCSDASVQNPGLVRTGVYGRDVPNHGTVLDVISSSPILTTNRQLQQGSAEGFLNQIRQRLATGSNDGLGNVEDVEVVECKGMERKRTTA